MQCLKLIAQFQHAILSIRAISYRWTYGHGRIDPYYRKALLLKITSYLYLFFNDKARVVLDAKDASLKEHISTLESEITGITAFFKKDQRIFFFLFYMFILNY